MGKSVATHFEHQAERSQSQMLCAPISVGAVGLRDLIACWIPSVLPVDILNLGWSRPHIPFGLEGLLRQQSRGGPVAQKIPLLQVPSLAQ